MATIEITEYDTLTKDLKGYEVQAPQEPSLIVQNVTYTTATNSALLQATTKLVRIKTSAIAYIKFNGTASASGCTSLAADTVEYFGVKGGTFISIYDGTS